MPDLIIVDGHNVLFSAARYRDAKERRGIEEAVDKMVLDLTNLAGTIDSEIIVVFDGSGSGSVMEMGAGLTVVYSAKGRTADEVIERLAFERSQRETITVFTADYAQRQTVWRRNVKCSLPDDLVTMMEESAEEGAGSLPPKRPLQIEDRLPESVRRSLDRMRREKQ